MFPTEGREVMWNVLLSSADVFEALLTESTYTCLKKCPPKIQKRSKTPKNDRKRVKSARKSPKKFGTSKNVRNVRNVENA